MTKTLLEKLGLKDGVKGFAINVPSGVDKAVQLSELPRGYKGAGFVICFVENAAAIARRSTSVLNAYATGGHLWMVYPKKSGGITTDITRDNGWRPLKDKDFHPVTQVAIDDTWSALRFRHRSEIKTMTRKAEML